MSDPGLEQVLERYRAEWDAGKFDRLIPAFMFCVKNRLNMPDWLYDAIQDELQWAYRHRQRGGKSARTGVVQDASRRKHKTRHLMMKTTLAQQEADPRRGEAPNKTEAAKLVERLLSHWQSPARGSWTSIIESYDLVESDEGKFQN